MVVWYEICLTKKQTKLKQEMKEKFNIDVYCITANHHMMVKKIMTKNRSEFVDCMINLSKTLGEISNLNLKNVFHAKCFDISGFWTDGFDGIINILPVNDNVPSDLENLFKKCYTYSRSLNSSCFVLDYDGIVYEIRITCNHNKTIISNDENEIYYFRTIKSVKDIIDFINKKNNLKFKDVLYVDNMTDYYDTKTKICNDVKYFSELCVNLLKEQNDICFMMRFIGIDNAVKTYNIYQEKEED